MSKNWNIVSHTNKELPITVTVNSLILTSSGQPNIEKGNKPEENHVSNTSSSAKGKMAHQNRTDKHHQSCRVTFHPFTPYLYKQTKRRKNKSNGKIAWVETVLSLDLGPDESGRGTELLYTEGKERKFNTLCFTFPSVFPRFYSPLPPTPSFLFPIFCWTHPAGFNLPCFRVIFSGATLNLSAAFFNTSSSVRPLEPKKLKHYLACLTLVTCDN